MMERSLFRTLTRVLDVVRDTLRGRQRAIFAHYPSRRHRIPAQFVPDIRATDEDVEICRRLLRAYEAANADDPSRGRPRPADVWTHIAKRQTTLFEALDRGDPARLAAYLCNMSRHDATQGTVQGDAEYQHLRRSRRYRRFVANMAKDKLVSLAEAVGALPSENPEQGSWGTHFTIPIEDVVRRIERCLGAQISPPPIDGGFYKIGSNGGLFHERDCNAIYTAWLVNHLLPGHEPPVVCEIGGGVGRVAYWSTRLGIRDYTLIDLPHINVLQGFYLLKSAPRLRVELHGEAAATGSADTDQPQITIAPFFARGKVRHDTFDLVLNQDSFPEINEDIVRGYLEWMATSTKFFLSINHESQPRGTGEVLQNNVAALLQDIGGYDRRLRQPYWLRRGYVMELYAVGSLAPV